MFENYIKNNLPSFEKADDKNEDEREIKNLSFKLFELTEFQKKVRVYYSFINICAPDSDLDKQKYFKIYGNIEDIAHWLVSEIDVTQKSLFK